MATSTDNAHHTIDVESPAPPTEDTGCFGKKGEKRAPLYRKPVSVEFRDFMLGGNLIRLAVAFVIAIALQALINQFVVSFITPIIGIIGSRSVEDLVFTIRGSAFRYGRFLDEMISFIMICVVLFFVLILPLQRYGGHCAPAWVMRKCPYCCSDMAAIGTKCPSCCSAVEPLAISPKAE